MYPRLKLTAAFYELKLLLPQFVVFARRKGYYRFPQHDIQVRLVLAQ